MNMLRVWGGGIYEDDIFYELCDKNGIMVWQDFMFACAMYPSNDEFLKSIQSEAEQNVKRLRNHTCIALWCGNNEIDEAWHNWGWSNAFNESDSSEIKKGYDTVFHMILPKIVSKHDPIRSYHSSSPLYGRGNPLSIYYGDSHYWGVWHDAEPFDIYEKKVPRFMSEYGFQSFPSIKTIKKFSEEDDLSIESDVMLSHQKHPGGNALIKQYMNEYYTIPEDFEEFVYLSQLMQAEGVRIGIEAHRRAKPYCGGTLFWQLNDCWPVVSWSSIDYYGNYKALQYFAKKAYESYLISFSEKNDSIFVHIISDELVNKKANLKLKIIDFDGNTLESSDLNIIAEANASKVYHTFYLDNLINNNNKKEIFLSAELHIGYTLIADAQRYFVSAKELLLSDSEPNIKIIKKYNKFEIILYSDKLIKNICLMTTTEGHLSDNFFDLLPGKEKIIYFYPKSDLIKLQDFKYLSLNSIFN